MGLAVKTLSNLFFSWISDSHTIFHLISFCIRWCTFDQLAKCVHNPISLLLFNFFLNYLHKLPENNAYAKAESRQRVKIQATVCVRTGYFYKSLFQTAVNPGLNATCEYRLTFHPAAAALTVLCECACFANRLNRIASGWMRVYWLSFCTIQLFTALFRILLLFRLAGLNIG